MVNKIVDFIKELLDVRHGNLEVDGFSDDELEMLLDYLCVSYGTSEVVTGVLP